MNTGKYLIRTNFVQCKVYLVSLMDNQVSCIEFKDFTGLNHIMFAHNSLALKNYNHSENNFLLTGFEPTPKCTAGDRSTT